MDCHKVKFALEEYALFHIKKHSKRNEDIGLNARAYKCLVCRQWHITSKVLNHELIQDNEDLMAQLIAQVKLNEDLKAEIEVLIKAPKKHIKIVPMLEPKVKQMKEKINKQERQIKELKDMRNLLLQKLNQFL